MRGLLNFRAVHLVSSFCEARLFLYYAAPFHLTVCRFTTRPYTAPGKSTERKDPFPVGVCGLSRCRFLRVHCSNPDRQCSTSAPACVPVYCPIMQSTPEAC